jgi:Fe-S-cluster-containing dehydrogenase component
MIGEGTHSTNQRRHTYVRDNVEVGFFTDPTVCIGCKACEVGKISVRDPESVFASQKL